MDKVYWNWKTKMLQTGQIEHGAESLHFPGDLPGSFFWGQFIALIFIQTTVLHRVFMCNGKLTVSVRKTTKGINSISALSLIAVLKVIKRKYIFIGFRQMENVRVS